MKKAVSERQLRIAEQIKHILANIMQQQPISDPIINKHLITISQVQLSCDLKLAKCYFTIFGSEDIKLVEARLNNHSRFIKGLCSKELKQLKYMPQLCFYYDDSFDNFNRINNLLKLIK